MAFPYLARTLYPAARVNSHLLMPHPEVDQLETTGRWMEAAARWRREYEATHSPEAAVRLAFVSWWVITQYGCIPVAQPLTDEDFARLHSTLKAVVDDALARHGNNPNVLFHLGLIISFDPWLFAPDNSDEAIAEWEQCARAMLSQAHRLCPDDPAYEVGYRGCHVATEEERAAYEQARLRAYPKVQERYPGAGEFDRYFRYMLADAA